MSTPPRPALRLEQRVAALEHVVVGDPDKKDELPLLLQVAKNIARAEAHSLLRDEKCLRDCGPWNSETTYGPGAMTTFDGQIYVAQAESSGVRPGTSELWRLAHKSIDVALKREIKSMVRAVVRDELGKARADER